MDFKKMSLQKADSRFHVEPHLLSCGDQADKVDDETDVCPICKGNGVLPKAKAKPVTERIPCTFSESALSSYRAPRRPRLSRYPPVHLPSLNVFVDTDGMRTVFDRKPPRFAVSGIFDRNLEETVRRAVAKFSSPEWEVQKEGLEECLTIAQDHVDEVEPHMNKVYRAMRHLLGNHRPRDALFVCHVACKYFAVLRSTSRPEFDELVATLLLRSADSSCHVRCKVNDALDTMVAHLPTAFALRPLLEKGCRHKNPLVRAATVRVLSDIVTYRTPSALLSQPHLRESCRRMIEGAARLLADNSLGTRAAAKNMFLKLVDHEEFYRVYESCSIDRGLKARIDRTLDCLRQLS